jgi:hypothetical protein
LLSDFALVSQPKPVRAFGAGKNERSAVMKKVSLWLALAGLVCISKSFAVTLDDIQFWTGTGTNRAALVIEWSAPESYGSSTVPAPIANKSLVWGYRFNGSVSAAEMFLSITAADPRFYAVGSVHPQFGLGITALGYHLGGNGVSGLTDGTVTNYFSSGLQTNLMVYMDMAGPVNKGDLYWGCLWGPNWEMWTEPDAAGGLLHSPARGQNTYWTSTDPNWASAGYHGEWSLAQAGLNGLLLTNGSWLGFSVAAAEYDFDLAAPYNTHKHAPALPDPAITALVKNLVVAKQAGQWRAQFISCTNWNYSLERSTNLQSWASVVTDIAGKNDSLEIADPLPAADKAFYRVRAEQP